MKGKDLVYALSLIGFVSVVGQVVLLREFMIVFYGNELSLGLILANWLLLVSLGSYLSGLLSDRFKLGIKTFIVLQMLVALTLPVQLYAVGAVRQILNITQGELIGLTQILGSSFLILAPLCIALGFQFSLGCKIYAEKTGKTAAGIGWVYVLEALGSLTGGVLFSYLLASYLNPFQIAFLVSMLSLTSALFLLRMENLLRSSLTLSASLLLTLATVFFLNTPPIMESYNRLYWGGDLISSENSIYGNIVVLERDKQYSFYENGLLMYTTRDTEFNEELIHFPLLEHPKPGNVLLVGGGAGGALREILKHPIDRVTYVELDPRVIEVSKRYVSEEDLEALNDLRVDVIAADGRFFIKESREKYDVVIVNLPEPSTAQLNRFYTQEFFEETGGVLDDAGILSIGIPSSESYVGEGGRILGGSVYKTMKTVFLDLIVIPGETSFLLASKNRDVLTYDPEVLSKRLENRGIKTELLDGSYIRYKLSGDRVNFTLNSLDAKDVQVNTDLRPVGYYYYILLWSSLTNPGFKSLFNTRLIALISIVFLLTAVVIWRLHRGLLIPSAIFTVGFTGMVYEIVSLIAFQALYGFLYYKIAVIIAAFMAGLALGGFYMNKIMGDKGRRFFARIEFSIALYSLLLPFMFVEMSRGSSLLLSSEIFPVLMAFAGFLVGLEFPLANKLYLSERKGVAQTAGRVYASDLLGACFGAFFSSAILIPLIGVVNLCILLAVLNLVMGLMVLFSR
jgi:spermidine synthase